MNSTPLFLNTSARDMFGDETATFNLDRGGQAVFSREQSDTGMIEVFCGDGMVVSGSRCGEQRFDFSVLKPEIWI